MPETRKGPYRWRTWLRMHLPYFVVNIGIVAKGKDCEKAGGYHEWYNIDDENSGCYHCNIEKHGQLWKNKATEQDA